MGNCTRHNEKDEGFFVIAMQISNFSRLSVLIPLGATARAGIARADSALAIRNVSVQDPVDQIGRAHV